MDEATALLTRDPSLAWDRQPPVQRHRRLVGHERAALGDPGPPGLVLDAGLDEVRVLDLDSRSAKDLEPSSRTRVRIERGCDDAAHPGGEHGLGARRRRSMVRAGLHGHEERRALGQVSRRLEREHLRVRLALSPVPALADDLAVPDNNGSNDGVRMRRPASLLRQLERPREVRVHAASWTSSW